MLSRFEPRAPRKLLVKAKQRDQLLGAIGRDGMTLVPLDIHFNEAGNALVAAELARWLPGQLR